MMRKLLFSLVMLFAANIVIGQYQISPDEILFVAEGDDLLEVTAYATNNTDSADPIYWKFELADDFPEDWTIQICAGVNCFGWDDLDCPPTAPSIVEIGDVSDPFKFTVKRTDSAPMNGTYFGVLKLYSDYEFTNEVGSSSSPTTSTIDEELSNLVLYPNPTTQSFQIKNDASISSISIYNIVGRELRKLNHSEGMVHDVSKLRSGMYLVRLVNNNGDNVKTMRLSKR